MTKGFKMKTSKETNELDYLSWSGGWGKILSVYCKNICIAAVHPILHDSHKITWV